MVGDTYYDHRSRVVVCGPAAAVRERKKELILEPKDCGGGAVMSYMERVGVC